MIGCPGECGTVVAAESLGLTRLVRVRDYSQHLAGHNSHAALAVTSACDAADALAVAVDGGNDAGAVRAVVAGLNGKAGVAGDEAAAALPAGRQADVCQVGMVELHALVEHCHDDVAAACAEAVPYRQHVHITS